MPRHVARELPILKSPLTPPTCFVHVFGEASVLDGMLLLGGLVESHVETWLWLALVLLIVEIFTSGFFMGALAISAAFTAGVAFFGMGPLGQLTLFALFSIGSMVWIRPLFVHWLAPDEVNTNANALVGQTGTVVDQVPVGSTGRVRLANEEWRATAGENIDVGELVQIVEVNGNTLTVSRV